MRSIKTAYCGGHARHLQGSDLPPSHSSISSVHDLLLCSFLLINRPIGLNAIVSKPELLWALTCTTSNFPASFIFRSFLFALSHLYIDLPFCCLRLFLLLCCAIYGTFCATLGFSVFFCSFFSLFFFLLLLSAFSAPVSFSSSSSLSSVSFSLF